LFISAAGSRKTTLLVDKALENINNKSLIVTYTVNNLDLIRSYITQRVGLIPKNIKIMSWFSFLLQECVRPYQNIIYDKKMVLTIFFVERKSTMYIPKSNVEKYYLASGEYIYTDKISEFALLCDLKSNGLLIDRLEMIYDCIFIDEIQDLAGYDFDFLELLFKSNINVVAVGDSRQATYFTNCSPKNKKYKGKNIISLFKDWEEQGLCSIIEKNECFRCNQIICDFADALYPNMPKTVSRNTEITGHDGVFIINEKLINSYINRYNPTVLRYSKAFKKADSWNAINFGLSKGQNYDRVLILPTKKIEKYLENGNLIEIGDIPKFYVAITRARYSVALVYDGKTCLDNIQTLDF